VTVIWTYTGLSTPEMEQRVTTYGEYSISSSVNGIKDIESQTLNGISIQKIFFQPDVNIDLAVAQIVAGTNSVRGIMPPGIQAPIVVRYSASRFRSSRSASARMSSTSNSSTTMAFTVYASASRPSMA
jgi:multidrug efflux pump subunit AcrB